MIKYLPLFILFPISVLAQKQSKSDKKTIEKLKTHITYLADEKLEGRRAGTNGEKLAYEYIANQFKNTGLKPAGTDGYLQPFDLKEEKEIMADTYFIIDEKTLNLQSDYFPLSFSGNAGLNSSASMSLKENGSVWFWNVAELSGKISKNPHFDLQQAILEQSIAAQKKGAGAFLIYNSSTISDSIRFISSDKTASLNIPVLYLTNQTMIKYLADSIGMHDFNIKVRLEKKKKVAHNVIGYIDNNAPTTIIIGAHFDHLGYGEDHNSLYSGKEKLVHNGADDNASGTAALIELSRTIKSSKLKKNNFLFIAFSGEELGLFGSKFFTEHPTTNLSQANYMINLDMVGRLNDSSKTLTIGGYGTSPSWSSVIHKDEKYFTLRYDSSGTGPSDHTSFYRKDIPVLFFFTGLHSDYHKPSDDENKINYSGELMILKFILNTIKSSEQFGKLEFRKTRETAMGTTSFKVSLGIMPDYTYSGDGVRVDGVSEGRQAQKAGIKAGDVLYQLNQFRFNDVQTYMDALNKFNKGDKARVLVRRGKAELAFDIVF